jgi:hypothetical protein
MNRQLHITRQTTTLAHLIKIIDVALFVLSLKNLLFDTGQNNAVNTLYVRRNDKGNLL